MTILRHGKDNFMTYEFRLESVVWKLSECNFTVSQSNSFNFISKWNKTHLNNLKQNTLIIWWQLVLLNLLSKSFEVSALTALYEGRSSDIIPQLFIVKTLVTKFLCGFLQACHQTRGYQQHNSSSSATSTIHSRRHGTPVTKSSLSGSISPDRSKRGYGDLERLIAAHNKATKQQQV